MKKFGKFAIAILLILGVIGLYGCSLWRSNATQIGTVIKVLPYAPIAVGDNVVASPTYYVSTTGADANEGSLSSPFATLDYALMCVNKFKTDVNDDMKIVLAEGYYLPRKTIEINSSVNLPNGKRLFIEAEDGKEVVISGGLPVYNWEETTVNGIKMVRAMAKGVSSVRQFYVNNSAKQLANFDDKISWAWGGTSGSVDKNVIKTYSTTFETSKIFNIKQLEFVWQEEWRAYIYRTVSNKNNVFKMQQEFERVDSMRRALPFFIPMLPDPNNDDLEMQNDVSFIDKPGEFCYDEMTEYLYYYPAAGENLNNSTCIIPRLDKVIDINGTIDSVVTNVTFSGLTFAHGQIDFISYDGLNIMQAQNRVISNTDIGSQSYMSDTIHGAVNVDNASGIVFSHNKFKDTSAVAIRMMANVTNCTIVGNSFTNIGDGAIAVGDGQSYSGAMPNGTTISNNFIRKIGQINLSAPAITLYQNKNSKTTYNDIYDIPYTGISSGWGWGNAPANYLSTNNQISYNRIGNYMNKMKDGGGIYTLDKHFGSTVDGNYLFELKGVGFSIYHDEGSRGFITQNNVVSIEEGYRNSTYFWLCINNMWTHAVSSGEITIQNNYFDHDNMRDRGENMTIRNNIHVTGGWNDTATAIIDNAGLQSSYQYLKA